MNILRGRWFPWTYLLLGISLLCLQAWVLHLMGQIGWCKCGFAIWTSHAWSNDTSQDFADPYSFTHIIHGMLFYGLLALTARKLEPKKKLILAMMIEIGWELLENSQMVISRYRSATASRDYSGDSILNSVGDVLFCVLGFYLAFRLSTKTAVTIVVLIEVVLLLTIRDNFTLNILMFVFPMQAVKSWQIGA